MECSIKYLTLNESLNQLSSVSDAINPADVAALVASPPPVLPLKRKWKIWEQLENEASQDYTSSMKHVASFDTVQNFWEMCSALPQPSQLMGDQRMVRDTKQGQQLVDAIMIFRDEVKPMWEDPLNSYGGHFEVRYNQSTDIHEQARVDEHWNNLLLAMIGATIELEGMITGLRLVDKLHAVKRVGGSLRIEIWITERGFSFDQKNRLKTMIERLMTNKLDGSRDPRALILQYRSHRPRR